MTKEETIKQVTKDISDMVNNMSFSQEEREQFAEEIMKDHRTLQQSTMRLFYTVIKAWAESDNYDARNEATILACKEIVETLENKKRDTFPFI